MIRKPLKPSISLMAAFHSQYAKNNAFTVIIHPTRKVLLFSLNVKVTSDDLSAEESPVLESSAIKNIPQYTVIIAVANDNTSKSKCESVKCGRLRAVSKR